MSDALEAEFAGAALDGEQRADLERRGIPWPLAYLVGRARIEWLEGGLYSPAPDGEPAWIIPCRRDPEELGFETLNPAAATLYGDSIDLVAVEPGRGGRIATRRGVATTLGNIEPQIVQPEPVAVWRSPWRWLLSGGRGLVLLGSPLDHYQILSGLAAIIAEDLPHARELRAIVERPFPAPPVLVADRGRRVA